MFCDSPMQYCTMMISQQKVSIYLGCYCLSIISSRSKVLIILESHRGGKRKNRSTLVMKWNKRRIKVLCSLLHLARTVFFVSSEEFDGDHSKKRIAVIGGGIGNSLCILYRCSSISS